MTFNLAWTSEVPYAYCVLPFPCYCFIPTPFWLLQAAPYTSIPYHCWTWANVSPFFLTGKAINQLWNCSRLPFFFPFWVTHVSLQTTVIPYLLEGGGCKKTRTYLNLMNFCTTRLSRCITYIQQWLPKRSTFQKWKLGVGFTQFICSECTFKHVYKEISAAIT